MKTNLVYASVGILLIAGCGDPSQMSKTDEAKVRAHMGQKKFDINQVPPNERDRVRGLMRANGYDPDTSEPIKR